MSFRYYFQDVDASIVEFTDRVQVGGLRAEKVDEAGTDGLVMDAEEGTVGSSSLVVNDPLGDFLINGHRLVYVTETECAGDAYGGKVWAGYSAQREVSRGNEFFAAGRTWSITLDDINTVFERRLMVGADNNRPAETDVERITWLLTTAEAALITDATYFSTDDPVDMDAVDYRTQSFRSIIDDCAQQSGKNWYLWPSSAGWSLWYAPRATSDFASSKKLSNDPGEIDNTTVYAPSQKTTLTRDPSRVYSGVVMAYDRAYVYVQHEATADAFARRDAMSPSPNVKTKTKAINRANRYLSDISTEEDIISTAIQVDRADANSIVAGQRVEVLFTHLPGYEDWVWMRVLNRTIREVSTDRVELALELEGDAPTPSGPPVYGVLQGSRGPFPGNPGGVWWANPGDTPGPGWPLRPTTGLIEPINDPMNGRTWSGWKVTGTGTIDVHSFITLVGVLAGSVTIHVAITKNGAEVVDEDIVPPYSGGLAFWGGSSTLDIDALAVVPNDVIKLTLGWTGPMFFGRTPAGTGQNGESLEITGGSLS